MIVRMVRRRLLYVAVLGALLAVKSAAVPATDRPGVFPPVGLKVSAAAARVNLAPLVRATIIRVIDGDTVEVDARPWPAMTIRIAVRLRGYDAPERRGKCEAERIAASAASAALKRLLAGRPLRGRLQSWEVSVSRLRMLAHPGSLPASPAGAWRPI